VKGIIGDYSKDSSYRKYISCFKKLI